MPAMHAYMDDFGKITIWMNRTFYGGRSDYFYLTSSSGFYAELTVIGVEEHPDNVRYDLSAPADLVFGDEYQVRESHGLEVPLIMRLIAQKQGFADMFDYDGDDLGPQYSPTYTAFNVWAPTASCVVLKLERFGNTECYAMHRTERGVYRMKVHGDLNHALYTYLVTVNGETNESLDPYALSSNANGHKSAVIDEREILKIRDHTLPDTIHSAVDAVIYECSVRDMTASSLTGTNAHGTFAALCEEGTSWKGQPTGMDYLKSLGVTHVQLQPVLDFATVDELHPDRSYNWGYDAQQYLTLEGSYASDPKDPYCRVREFKKLVTTFHKNGMRVTLDVVFNHMYNVETSAFHRIVPYYYFRYNDSGFMSNGSYCGNDLSSCRPMMRRYILHVCKTLMRLYGVDGYRFDLMGVLDVNTMNAVLKACREVKKDALVYGEGWDMPTILPYQQKACIVNQNRMPDIGHFNDYFRDIVKGRTSDDQKYAKGYITGDLNQAFGMCSAIAGNVLGSPYFYRFDSPCKTINCVETHDNGTVWDKLRVCCQGESHDARIARIRMLTASVLFSQGVPFLHAGQEFCGTKNGNSNSYNAGDAINQMDWERAAYNFEMVDYTRRAVALRLKYRGFRLSTGDEISKCLHLSVAEGNIVMCDIDYVDQENGIDCIRLIFNPSYDNKEYWYGEDWHVVFDELGHERNETGRCIYVPGLSVIVAVHKI